jgi:hypothetical protein
MDSPILLADLPGHSCKGDPGARCLGSVDADNVQVIGQWWLEL